MQICYAISRYLSSKQKCIAIPLLVFALIAGCSNPQEEAAHSAAEAQSYLSQNRFGEARNAIKKAISAKDDVAEYHMLLGRIEYAADAFANAFAAYNEALALDSTNQEALQAISQIGLRVGRLNESLDATNKLLVLNPGQKDALLTLGLHALVKRNYAEALTNADKILVASPLDEGGVVLKARASFLSENTENALKVLNDFEASKPSTAAISLTRLEIYRELRDAQQMDRQFVNLERLLPADLALRVDSANFYYKTGKSDRATQILASMMANEKASVENISAATALWREYLITKLDPDLARAISRSGNAAARLAGARYFATAGDTATSTLLIGRMSGINADVERANIAMLAGKVPLARSLIEKVLTNDATHCAALGTQASLRLAEGRRAVALQSAQKASSECPDQPQLWKLTALIYSELGDEANARRVFRQGIEANKQNEFLTRAYAQWLKTKGADREAVAAARRLTRSAPALTSGWRLYAEVCKNTQSSCVAEADLGLKDSMSRYGIDLAPGQLPPNGLFGRFVIR